jgi:hypothetical protein
MKAGVTLKVFAFGIMILVFQNVFSQQDQMSKDKKESKETSVSGKVEVKDTSTSASYNGREYHFFDDNVFECDLFMSSMDENDLILLNNSPILRAYFLMIYPASSWLEEESLHILEIL